MRRRLLIILGIVVGVLILALAPIVCLGVDLARSFPTAQQARVDGGDVVGVQAGGAYAWVVPTATGVVLVDTGMGGDGDEVLRKEIAGRPIQAVFITHGHFDHIGGFALVGDAPVYCGPGEHKLIRGEELARGWIPSLLSRTMSSPPPPSGLQEARDGQVVEVDGASFTVVHVPGHTDGSAAFLYKDVLFTGDSLVGYGDHVGPLHWLFANDIAQNRQSIRKLAALGADRVADGHAGLHRGVGKQLQALWAQ